MGRQGQSQLDLSSVDAVPARPKKHKGRAGQIGAEFWSLRAALVIVLTPLFLLPLPVIVQTNEARCAFVVLLMAVYWTSEMIPLAATSMMPAFLFPILGVMTAGEVCQNYIKDTSMLYVGGLIVAIAIEKLNLHKRIALRVLLVVGADPKWLILGLMLPTWFLSMWISNTATAAMMVPIANAMLAELKLKEKSSGKVDPELGSNNLGEDNPKEGMTAPTENTGGNVNDNEKMAIMDSSVDDKLETNGDSTGDYGTFYTTNRPRPADGTITKLTRPPCGDVPQATLTSSTGTGDGEKPEPENADFDRLCKAMMLSIAYAANVGGLATLTGTPPNLVLQGNAEITFREYGGTSPITYTNWIIFALPLSIICFACAWFWILLYFLRKKFWQRVGDEQRKNVKAVLFGEYRKLGPMSYGEMTVLVLFILLALLWLTRNPVFIPGWGSIFRKDYVKDSTAAMFIALLLFILPVRIPRIFCCRSYRDKSVPVYTPILDWDTVHRKMPWGIILLFGGGFALADGCQKSGLSKWVGEALGGLSDLDPWVINLILTFIVAAATEVTSNLATATLLLPILSSLALTLGLNPLYFMMSAVVATSFAFMLPVATPPNAIVFSHGFLKVTDMAKAGVVMNILCVMILTLAINTWGEAYFNLSVQPDIFKTAITTEIDNTTLLIFTLTP